MSTDATVAMELPAPGKPAPAQLTELSEQEFLEREIRLAEASLQRSVQELKESVPTAVSPTLWTQRYPWVAVGVAATTGFLAARMLLPARRPAIIVAAPPASGPAAPAAPPPANRGSFLGSIASSLFQVAAHGLLSSALSTIQSAAENPSQTDDAAVPPPSEDIASAVAGPPPVL